MERYEQIKGASCNGERVYGCTTSPSCGPVIGKGSFGTAVLCRDKASGTQVVVKRIDVRHMKPEKIALSVREADILRSLSHPGQCTQHRQQCITLT